MNHLQHWNFDSTTQYEHLLFYEEGDTICPKLESSLAASRKFLDELLDEDAFRRYYPMLRIRLQHNDIADIITALMINDGLYAYSKILAEQRA